MIKRSTILSIALTAALALVVGACSSSRNTAGSRWWQAFNTRYNVYYNGNQAYIEGMEEKEKGNRDNFTELIPLYSVNNKGGKDLGKGQLQRAVEKAEKAIKLHSIKRKPVWKAGRRKTERDLEWLNRREYNPFLWKAWMLMGRAQFHKGDFQEAISTFSYMMRLYATQPAIKQRAQAWLAKAYVAADMIYDAEDVIRNQQRDSLHWRANKEWDYTLASYYLHTENYEKAAEYLQQVIKHEMRRKQRAREYYLLGQLYAKMGRREEAARAFKRVSRLSPPYELDFNAQIALTEVMAQTDGKRMKARLKRMAASDNNKEFLDQVYYALGNVYLAERDTTKAIEAYEEGAKRTTRSGVEKGVLLLRLGHLYWVKERYADARRCYSEALGLLDKEHPAYQTLMERTKVLDQLVPHTETVHLQDSLQALAKMDERDRNAAIDRVIEALKKKEREERDALAEQQSSMGDDGRMDDLINRNNGRTVPPTAPGAGGKGWYFYNPVAVQQGKQAFEKLWGRRPNADNWRRMNRTVVQMSGQEAPTDSVPDNAELSEGDETTETASDSLQNDPHQREYYLRQIPFTPEQLEASNQLLMDGLYNSGVIFKDQLDQLTLSERALRRLSDDYPQYEHMENVAYHLYLLYSRRRDTEQAQQWLNRLRTQYPESQWTKLLNDPYYEANAVWGVHLEDSLYAATYNAFRARRYAEVLDNEALSAKRFPQGANRGRFVFLRGLTRLHEGQLQAALNDMTEVVEKYPDSPVAEMAGMMVKGVKEGRPLRGAADWGNVWERRTAVMEGTDSTQVRQWSNDRTGRHVFMLVYSPDSVQENQLLYEMARYNFSSYLVRDFDIVVENDGPLRRMKVSGFRSLDEARAYARQFFADRTAAALAVKARPVVISEVNLPLLGTQFSYDDYAAYFQKHFAPFGVQGYQLLTQPEEVVSEPQPAPTPQEIDKFLDAIAPDGSLLPPAGTVPSQEQAPSTTPQGTTIPLGDDVPTTPQGTTIPLDEGTPTAPQGTTIPLGEDASTTPQGTTVPLGEDAPTTPQGTTVPLGEDAKRSTPTGTTVPQEEQPRSAQPSVPTPTVEKGTTVPITPATEKANEGQKQPERKPLPSATPTASPQPQQSKGQPQQRQPQSQPSNGQPLQPQSSPSKPSTPVPSNKQLPQMTGGVEVLVDDAKALPPSNSKPKAAPAPKQKPKEDKKAPELEDEYYDLDGF